MVVASAPVRVLNSALRLGIMMVSRVMIKVKLVCKTVICVTWREQIMCVELVFKPGLMSVKSLHW